MPCRIRTIMMPAIKKITIQYKRQKKNENKKVTETQNLILKARRSEIKIPPDKI